MRDGERQSREQLPELEVLYRTAPLGLCYMDTDLRYLRCNEKLAEINGVSAADHIGRTLREIVPEIAETMEPFYRQAIESGEPVIDILAMGATAADPKKTRHFSACYYPVKSEDGVVLGVSSIVQEITQRKRAEEELAEYRQHLETLVEDRTTELKASHARLRAADRLASIGTLTAGLGHDMSNILLPLRLRLDALDWRTVPDGLKELIEVTHRAVDYLHQMCVGLRSLAINSPKGDVPCEVTALSDWWIEAEPLMKAVLHEGVRLENDLPGGVPPVGVAPHRLTQAVLNLTVNAGEAMPDGGSLRLWSAADEDDGIVQIGITDEGVGMTEKVQLQVLDPFFTTKTRGLSTGLGLALVHGVVASSGGTMHIDSEPGKGTTVVLKLPIADLGAPARSTAPKTRVRAVVSLRDPQTTAWVSILLTSAGFEVNRTGNAESDGSRLWVTEPTAENLRVAKRFYSGRSDRRIIVLGQADRAWTDLGAIVVEESKDLKAIELALGELPPIPVGE